MTCDTCTTTDQQEQLNKLNKLYLDTSNQIKLNSDVQINAVREDIEVFVKYLHPEAKEADLQEYSKCMTDADILKME